MDTTIGTLQPGVTLVEGDTASGKTQIIVSLITEYGKGPSSRPGWLFGDLAELRNRSPELQSLVADKQVFLLDTTSQLQERVEKAEWGEFFCADDLHGFVRGDLGRFITRLHESAKRRGAIVVATYQERRGVWKPPLENLPEWPPTFKLIGHSQVPDPKNGLAGASRPLRGKTHFPCMPGDTIIERVFPQPPPGGRAVLTGFIVSTGPGGVECGTFEAYSLELYRVKSTGERSNLLLSDAWCLAFDPGQFSQHELELHSLSAVFEAGDHLEVKVVSASMDLRGHGFEGHYAWEIYE